MVGVLQRQSRNETRNISRKDGRRIINIFFKIIDLFRPKLGVLCALAGVKSPDRKFHVEQ
jgi:hypothetical protein